jgi:hypothetical protein
MTIRAVVFYAVMLLILSAGFYGGYRSYAAQAASQQVPVSGIPSPQPVPADVMGWELYPASEGALPVQAEHLQYALYLVGSRMVDDKALGGFGPCDNYAWPLKADQIWGQTETVSVVVFPEEIVAFSSKERGLAVRVLNRTNQPAAFHAQDSKLTLIAQAQDEQGRWRDIEVMRNAFCGNSHHRVFLEPGHYWQHPVRQYAGTMSTRLRYRLDLGDSRPPLYSNEFEGSIHPNQFYKPEPTTRPHTSN